MKYAIALLALLYVSFLPSSGYSQVIDVNDPLVVYDPDNPPVVPPNGILADWVYSPEVNWNSSRWKSYILNGIAMRLRFPNNYDPNRPEKYPMIVILHGLGYRDGNLYLNDRHLNNSGAKAYEDAINRGKFDGFVLSPQSTNPWFNEYHIDVINQFIDKAKDQVNLNVNRISINGRSGGAQQVWLFIQNSPKTYAAATPMSGVKSTSTDNIDAYKHMPIWLFQGALDKGPTPFTTEGVISEIVAKGGNVTYTKYKKGGHGIFNTGYAEPDYFPFFERVHKANPTVLQGTYASVYDDDSKVVYQFIPETQPCPGDVIHVKMGLTAGFDAYQWRKDGTVISGATDHEYTATSLGVYEARFRRDDAWSEWSPRPVEVKRRPATETPDIQIVGQASQVLPTLGSQTSVPLELPQGYASYEWRNVANDQVVSTERVFEATEPGQYVARVTENLGCSSSASRPFTVVDASGANGPADLLSFGGVATSQTDISVTWSANPNDPSPATGYELYRSTAASGGFNFVTLIESSATEWTDNGLVPNTTYYFQLRAVNNTGASSATSIIEVKTQVDSNPPSAPTELTTTEITPFSVALDWNEATDDIGVARYDVYRDGIKVLSTEASEATIYNLQANTTYEFKVKAKDQTGNESPFSNRVLATPSFAGEVAIRLPLDGNVTDASVNATSARVQGSLSYSSTDKVVGSASASFSGNGAFIDLDRGNQFVHASCTERTIAFWLKSGSETGIQDVFDEGGSGNGLGLRLNGTNLEFAVRNGGTQRTLSAPFPSGSWHHVVAVYKEGTIILYVNGISVATNTSVPFSQINSHGNGAGLGGTNSSNAFDEKSNSLTGLIDDFHLFTKALSEDEIAQLADRDTGNPNEFVAAPENVIATAVSFSSMRVAWEDKSDNEVEFQVYRARESGSFTPIGLVDANDTVYLDSGLTAETTYAYYVVALGENGTSDPSVASNSVTTLALPAGPAAPTALEATEIRHDQVTVAFSDNSDNEDYFEIFRAINTPQNFQSIKKLTEYAGSPISYTDRGLQTNIRYFYKVVAVNAGGATESEVLEVSTLNRIPELAEIQDFTIRQGESYELALIGSDADGDALTLSATNLPSFARLEDNGDGTGQLIFSPTSDDAGEYPDITVTLRDNFDGTARRVFTLTVNSNARPQLAAVANISVAEGDEQMVPLSATDEDGVEELQWEGTLPSFAQLNAATDGTAQLILRPNFTDQGEYPSTITVTDTDGAAASQSFTISVTGENPNTIVRVNFTQGTPLLGGSDWNNTAEHPAQGDHYADLTDRSGNNTGFGLTIASSWRANGSNTLGASTGNNSGVFPDNVLKSAYWTDSTVPTVSLDGLDDTRAYHLTFLGSRAANDDRTTVYTVGTQSVSLNAAGNTDQTVTLRNLSPQNGTISFTVQKGGGSDYGYLNALIIEEEFENGDAPAKPTQLTATFDTETGDVVVRWKDVAFNEAGYRVFRASEATDPFEEIATIAEVDATVYRDGDVTSNTAYYYRVRAYNSSSESEDSEVVSVEVPNVAPRLASVDDVVVVAGEEALISVTATDDAADEIMFSTENLPAFATLTTTASGSATLRIQPVVADIGIYPNVQVIAVDQYGEQSEETFSITVQPSGLLTYYVNLAGTQAYAAATPWNNYIGNGSAGDELTAIHTQSGEGALLNIQFQDAWGGANSTGMVGSTVYPDNVTRSALWIGDNQERRIVIRGLALDQAYDFTFFGSRNGDGDRTTNYSTNGTTVSLNASFNQNNTVQLEGVVPSSIGEVTIRVSRAAGSSYGYLNALVINGYPADVVPSDPSQLMATPAGDAEVSLRWLDNTNQETGYEIWRSTSYGSGYSLVHTTEANATAYTDGGLNQGTTYYYKVRAVLGGGSYSSYSAVAAASPVNAIVSINFNVTDPAAAPWNNTNAVPDPGLVFNNLKNQRGNGTGIAFEIVDSNPSYDPSLYGFSGDNPFGVITGDNSGVVPDNVMRSTYWMDPGKTAELRFFGLDLSQRYNFRFFASRDGGGNRTTVYRINGESVKLNAAGNTDQTVQIDNVVPDADGEVIVSITSDAGASFSYLGAIILESSNHTAVAARSAGPVAKAIDEADVLIAGPRISVYPNPHDGVAPLQVGLQGNPDQEITIRIYNSLGSMVYEKQIGGLPDQARLEVDWPASQGSGVYMLYVSGKRMGTHTQRVLRQ